MCIPVYVCTDGTAPHLCIPLLGVEVRLGTTMDEKYISHMASSKNPKRTLEEYLSDDKNTQITSGHTFQLSSPLLKKNQSPLYFPLPKASKA